VSETRAEFLFVKFLFIVVINIFLPAISFSLLLRLFSNSVVEVEGESGS